MDREEGRFELNEEDEGEGWRKPGGLTDDVEGHIAPDDGEGVRRPGGLNEDEDDEGEGYIR